MIPCNFFGELGIFRELPNGKTISDYTPFLSLIQPNDWNKRWGSKRTEKRNNV